MHVCVFVSVCVCVSVCSMLFNSYRYYNDKYDHQKHCMHGCMCNVYMSVGACMRFRISKFYKVKPKYEHNLQETYSPVHVLATLSCLNPFLHAVSHLPATVQTAVAQSVLHAEVKKKFWIIEEVLKLWTSFQHLMDLKLSVLHCVSGQ